MDTYAYLDGGFDVRWKDVSIPYFVFGKDQQDTHAGITENKRLDVNSLLLLSAMRQMK